jgi:uncharacterized iron-regulated membrane protein
VGWLSVIEMVALGIFCGVASGIVIPEGRLVQIWALVVSLIFCVAFFCAILFSYSWMFTLGARVLAQEIAVAAGFTGLAFAFRSKA